jgi:hypothetical protein
LKTLTLNAIEQTVFTMANEQYETLLNTIRSPEYQALEHGKVEQFVYREGTELRETAHVSQQIVGTIL